MPSPFLTTSKTVDRLREIADQVERGDVQLLETDLHSATIHGDTRLPLTRLVVSFVPSHDDTRKDNRS